MEERELKLPVGELDTVRRRLVEMGAESVSEAAVERNAIFDRDGEVYGSGRALRLRVDSHGVRLTFKGRARYEDGVKIRRELETAVESAEAMLAILEALGYRRVTGYEKVREEWRLDDSLIALDHTPIGDYVEVEDGDPSSVATALGLEIESAEPRSYLSLYAAYRVEHPEAPAEMQFL